MSEVLLDPTAIGLALRRLAAEIVERSRDRGDTELPVLVGIRRGGDPLARRIAALIEETGAPRPTVGAVDITLYRDDAATALPNPRIGPSKIPVSLDGRSVLLVDDVVSTGRTIRAALDAVLDFGRPKRIELAALIDRGGRELPIQPDFTGLRAQVPANKRVEVVMKRFGPGTDEEDPWAILVASTPDAAPSTKKA